RGSTWLWVGTTDAATNMSLTSVTTSLTRSSQAVLNMSTSAIDLASAIDTATSNAPATAASAPASRGCENTVSMWLTRYSPFANASSPSTMDCTSRSEWPSLCSG